MESQMSEEAEISFLQDFKDKIIERIKEEHCEELLNKIIYNISPTWLSITFIVVDKISDSDFPFGKINDDHYDYERYTLIRCKRYCFLNGDLLCSVCPFYAECVRNKPSSFLYLKLTGGKKEIIKLFNIINKFLKAVGYISKEKKKYPDGKLIMSFYYHTLTI